MEIRAPYITELQALATSEYNRIVAARGPLPTGYENAFEHAFTSAYIAWHFDSLTALMAGTAKDR
jgi:hypothetical protein